MPPLISSLISSWTPDWISNGLQRLHTLSLQRSLLLLLFPGLLAVAVLEIALTWRTAVQASDAAYDRSLLGAIKALDANISTESGGLAVELPYRMLEFFELTASGQVYYRVALENGLAEIGNAGLPPPAVPLVTGQPQFDDTTYFSVPVRMGSYARVLERPMEGQPLPQRVVIQIAETMESRHAFMRSLVLQSLARDLLLVAVASVLLVLAVDWALRPLARLKQEVQARQASDLRPISPQGIPLDVQPLVEAINHHVARIRQQAEARRRFVDDASHQLRTPLATLATQVGFALRESDPASQREALAAIRSQLDEAVRQTNQMLALARADSVDAVDAEAESVDLCELAQAVARRWWNEAREHGVDLGFEAAAGLQPGAACAWAQPGLLREAVSNLLHNAIRYTPRGSQVTVRVDAVENEVAIGVIDNGPGMPPHELARAGERFFRGSATRQPGSGLGLAIVKSIAERFGGRLTLAAGADGHGLEARIVLPSVPLISRLLS
ncbi:MAG: sensor histidine kinase N-terminal domain-containing protein [Pseudomonadota bacterium]|nr:sensor histidine kinase N-terminal domain-containing protein [Pseudomonadota bacterium]